MLSEFGGYAYRDPEHSAVEKSYGYRTFHSTDELTDGIRGLLDARCKDIFRGLCAYIYTQWSDIEEEVNGIYTYDRRVRKVTEGTFNSVTFLEER